ncbi:DNA polymerase ligase N-terminal domain-containing protein [Thalassoglobus sp.]|uniref:DNA polymerase ligase N-terminal domain-containing protein n=1 Tax=Thalassoglobus sp. TaxID=2795869 RepID=UPI003AA9C3E2
MLRYVILTHTWPTFHWDFMLEWEGKLLSWRILKEPTLDTPLTVLRTPDHRIEYLKITGPVSGGRGEVQQWDHGLLKIQSLREDEVCGLLESSKHNGLISFEIKNDILKFSKESAKTYSS